MASDRLYEFNGQKGHWYTDDQGNRYFVAQGQTPKEGWEATKRRKMIKGGKYVKDDGDDKGEQEISANEYQTYEADEEERFDETTDADFEDDEPEGFDRDDDDERSWGPDQPEDEIWAKFDEWKEYAFAENQTPENIEKGNKLSEEWSEELYDYMTEDQKKEFERIYDTADPDELEGFVANVIGNRRNGRGSEESDEESAATNREAAQKLGNAKPTDFSPYVFDTDQGRFSIVNDEQARKDGAETIQAYFQDEQGFDTFPAEIAQDLKAKFGDPSQDEDLEIDYQRVADYFIDKYGYSRILTPHTGKVIDLGGGYKAYQISEKQGPAEKQVSDGYYKDDDGKIYMTKGGKDHYPMGEAERKDFIRAFDNQNREKDKELANDPETAKSFNRIHADLVKGFEETYKREPTKEEKDAIRDIARSQTALIVMARKK